MKPRGYQQLTVTGTAVGLTIPSTLASANYALIQCSLADVRWRDDGTSPTTTTGHLLTAGGELVYDGEVGAIKFIRTGATSAQLDISYYRREHGE